MPSIMYNDDINITNGDKRIASNIESWIDDISSHDSDPTVNPYKDGTNRNPDGWSPNQTASGGSGGETYNDTPPTEKPLPTYRTETVTLKKRTIINDYSQSYLKSLHDQGVKFYVIYSDGTENEVSYTEIYNPRQVKTEVYVNEALQIAEATDQHFWHDDSGAHVTDVEQDAWKTAAGKNFNDLSDSKPYHNILMNSLGILLRRALYNLVSISKSAIAFYDGLGNKATNIVASFGRNGIQIGASDRKHLYMDENGVAVYNADGSLATFNAQNIQSDHITIGNIENSISDIATIRTNSQKVNGLTQSQIEATLSESRYVYISKASGTLSVSKPTSKVTETGDVQNTWTLKRPTYNSNYPVLFLSVQSVTAKGTVVFTTPAKDDTLTVIDGGHITTGTIDASRIAVDQISVGSLHDGADYATKALALNNFQQVYISKSANTTSMSAPTTWITTSENVQNTWTTARPSYNSSYPKIFTSNQTKAANGTISSSTPTLDTATTDAISTAATDATTKADNAKSAAISAAATDATTKANNAQSAAATDATTKANAAAKTATNYITVIDNDGIKVHASNNPNTNYSRIDADGMDVIKNSVSVAKFGETARVGRSDKEHITITPSSGINMYDSSGSTSVLFAGVSGSNSIVRVGKQTGSCNVVISSEGYVDVRNASTIMAHFGYGPGKNQYGTNVDAPYYDIGIRASSSTIGNYSLVTGNACTASGYYSHVGGYRSTASGFYSYARGYSCTASGSSSMAIGEYTVASGDYSFAGGSLSEASGVYAFGFGQYVKAQQYQFVCGRYNSSGGLFTVGGGADDDHRRNAFLVNSTTAYFFSSSNKGTVYVNGQSVHSSDKRLKDHVAYLDEDAADFIRALKPVRYKWKGEDGEHYGFYAQDVQDADPHDTETVTEGEHDESLGFNTLSLDYQALIAPLVAYAQQLERRIDQQQEAIEALTKRLDKLESEQSR